MRFETEVKGALERIQHLRGLSRVEEADLLALSPALRVPIRCLRDFPLYGIALLVPVSTVATSLLVKCAFYVFRDRKDRRESKLHRLRLRPPSSKPFQLHQSAERRYCSA
jgi:hypothetical protein